MNKQIPPLSKYGSIEQFRHVVKIMQYYTEQDIIPFNGTVKLHGTNAGIGYKPGQPIWCQSRKKIITSEPKSDNAGFAKFVSSNEEEITKYIQSISDMLDIDVSKNEYCVFFGEWCGKGIQKGVGITELSKRFIVFEIQKITPISKFDDETNLKDIRYFYSNDLVKNFCLPECMIWNIYQFPTWDIDIDFANPKIAQNKLIEITNSVETECPVAKYFGVSGIGEGVVWRGTYAGKRLIFKVKGNKHSVTNVKKIASTDVEKLESSQKFVEYALTVSRLEQGWNEIMTNVDADVDLDMKHVGKFLSWIVLDIEKEESDTLSENNLTIGDVKRTLIQRAKSWFIANLDSQLLLN